MHITTKLVTAVCLAATLTACTAGDDSAADTSTIDTAPGPIAPAPDATVEGPATPAATSGESELVHVPLKEWSVTVSKSVLAPGATTFHAMNQGTYTHAFEIEGNDQEWKSDPIPPGGTATLTPTLAAGTYTVYCPITDSHGNHRQRGMSTTFTVR
jgi:uncharacterized cupredoxin-like copper-binding protein